MTNLLTYADWDEEAKELKITVNPYFYEVFVVGTVMLIDVVERAKLNLQFAAHLLIGGGLFGPPMYPTLVARTPLAP